MRQGYQEILDNAEQEVEYVSDFLSDLLNTVETRKLWRAWSGILEHYVKAVSALRRATDQGKSKAWSDRLMHQQKEDPILQYAYQSRDHAAHVFEGKREAQPRSVSLGNFISAGGNSQITLSNNTVIGPDGRVSKLPDGFFNTTDGRYDGGTIPINAVQEREHFVILKDVKTRSGVWQIPNPDTLPENRAIEIGQYVHNWLRERSLEARELERNEKK